MSNSNLFIEFETTAFFSAILYRGSRELSSITKKKMKTIGSCRMIEGNLILLPLFMLQSLKKIQNKLVVQK